MEARAEASAAGLTAKDVDSGCVGSEDVVLLTRSFKNSSHFQSPQSMWSAKPTANETTAVSSDSAAPFTRKTLETHVAHLAGQVEVCVHALEDSGTATGTDGDRLDFVRASWGPRSLDWRSGGGCRSAWACGSAW